MKTRIMRVPREFWDEVDQISSARNVSKAEFLRKDGVRIMRNCKELTEMLFWRRK